jgi:heme exporter protein D
MSVIDLDVGKYAAFIWPAYAVTALAFAVLTLGALNHSRRWKKRAEELSAK